MRPAAPLGAEAILQIWERGRREHPVDRALTILAVLSGRPRRELAAISVERRDSLLLEWRSRLFGDSLAGYAACPQCGCGVDVSLTPVGRQEPEERFVVEVSGQSLTVRLPTSLDLAAITGCGSVEAARHMLVPGASKTARLAAIRSTARSWPRRWTPSWAAGPGSQQAPSH